MDWTLLGFFVGFDAVLVAVNLILWRQRRRMSREMEASLCRAETVLAVDPGCEVVWSPGCQCHVPAPPAGCEVEVRNLPWVNDVEIVVPNGTVLTQEQIDAMRMELLQGIREGIQARCGDAQRHHTEQRKAAHDRGMQLLKENLRPAQLKQFEEHGFFDVVGSRTYNRYRICSDRQQFNVIRLNMWGARIDRLCFGPAEPLCLGDVLLAQKIGLECDEDNTLSIANRGRLQ